MPQSPTRRGLLGVVVLFVAWAGFAAWCVSGRPPSVDLPIHAAQLEILARLVRGDSAAAAIYRFEFVPGYGVFFWLFLPIALLSNGAVAARLALWLGLVLFPLALDALLRAFDRPRWYVLAGLPLAFNISYYYGFVAFFLGVPLVMVALCATRRALEEPRWRPILVLNALGVAVLLEHILAFVLLATAALGLALSRRPWSVRLRTLVLSLAAPGLLALLSAVLQRSHHSLSLEHGGVPLHMRWFVVNYVPEGRLAALGSLVLVAAFLARWWPRRRAEPSEPPVMLVALGLLYLLAPRSVGEVFGVFIRVPVLAGAVALLLVSGEAWSRAAKVAFVALAAASLLEVALFHERFARAVDGLDEIVAAGPLRSIGFVSLVGDRLLGSRHIYLSHMGLWLVAEHGAIGNVLAGDQLPVQFRRDIPAPWGPREEGVDTVVLFGPGAVPPAFDGWRVVATSGAWRRLQR